MILERRREGPVEVLTLNRPEVGNALSPELLADLGAALAAAEADGDVRAIVLTGAGERIFCAGMDLKAFATDGLPTHIDDVFRNGCAKPLIAAIEGIAVGGGLEMALIADLLVASADARLGSTEVKFGLFPGGGALLRLPRTLPQSLVAELAFTGRLLSAQEAHAHGLVVRVCEPGRTLDTALELAAAIARNAPLGVAAVKRLLRMAPGRTEEELWAEQRRLVDAVFHSEDAAEGAQAFAEKRPPQWSGR